MLAAAEGKLSIIQFLLKSGADPELKDYRKQTAADWAEERGNHEVISYLTKYAQDQRKYSRTAVFVLKCILLCRVIESTDLLRHKIL